MSRKEEILDNLSSARMHIRDVEVTLHSPGLINLDELEVSIEKAMGCLKATGLGSRVAVSQISHKRKDI